MLPLALRHFPVRSARDLHPLFRMLLPYRNPNGDGFPASGGIYRISYKAGT